MLAGGSQPAGVEPPAAQSGARPPHSKGARSMRRRWAIGTPRFRLIHQGDDAYDKVCDEVCAGLCPASSYSRLFVVSFVASFVE